MFSRTFGYIKNNSFMFFAIVVGIVGANLFASSGTTLFSRHKEITEVEVRAGLLETDFGQLYNVIAAEFPSEFDAMIKNTVSISNDKGITKAEQQRLIFQSSQEFTATLRTENIHHIAHASTESLHDLQAASLAVMEALQTKPTICAKYVLFGGVGLSRSEAQELPFDLVMDLSTKTFVVIAEGRKEKILRPAATEEDWQSVAEQWMALPTTDADYLQVLISPDANNPLTCAAALSFERFLTSYDGENAASIIASSRTEG
ncbi:hypothetical protein J3R80_11790 [Aliiroseovarius sp. Z3]|uniref:hypothetical protein n=1 Tax=Aliiroseovarius sp. Z3 TaxID=2811402 RepID=UPI0023B35526|nr:hypothetical protein [Aliiroseovarius sp. Z3]MDE9451146.1 hypothetical protein [Aliiroseovarius sp. Z3]